MKGLASGFGLTLGLTLGLLLASSSARASDTRVVSVDTDAFTGTEYLDVIRDSTGALTSMVYTPVGDSPFTLTYEQLRSGPQPVKKLNGRYVSYLSVESDFTEAGGGHANLRFLSNGITGTFLNFRILIQLNGNSVVLRSDPNASDPNSDHNAYTSVFDHLFMEKKVLLGQTVGIAAVIPSVQ